MLTVIDTQPQLMVDPCESDLLTGRVG